MAPLSLQWYNDKIPSHLRLSPFGHKDNVLAVVIGNTNSMWEKFKQALRNEMGGHMPCLDDASTGSELPLRTCANPIDEYVRRAVCRAVSEAAPGVSTALYWQQDIEPTKLVAMQRMAHIARMAYLCDTCHLCIHPVYGPWISLRAVAVFDLPPLDPGPVPPAPLPDPLEPAQREHVRALVDKAIAQSSTSGQGVALDSETSWKAWLRVRDSLAPPGTPWARHRFTEDQILYHYTGNREELLSSIDCS
eukprot:jgi/Mesvir1/11744/Mv00118-RA.1